MPLPCTHSYSVPDLSTPCSTTRWPLALTSSFPNTRRYGPEAATASETSPVVASKQPRQISSRAAANARNFTTTPPFTAQHLPPADLYHDSEGDEEPLSRSDPFSSPGRLPDRGARCL